MAGTGFLYPTGITDTADTIGVIDTADTIGVIDTADTIRVIDTADMVDMADMAKILEVVDTGDERQASASNYPNTDADGEFTLIAIARSV